MKRSNSSFQDPFVELGYSGRSEFHPARYGETSILSKDPADAVTFDVPLCDEPQQVVGLSIGDVESMARLMGYAIFHGSDSAEERSRITERTIAEIQGVACRNGAMN